jgi:hypothetical protein
MVVVIAATALAACPSAASAQTPGQIVFTTIQHGEPNPVAPGGTITWFLQAVNQGQETLADVSWSNPQCGSGSVAGLLAPGDFSNQDTCQTTAPQTGEAVLVVQWSARVVSTGELLTPVVTTTVLVAETTTTTATTTTSMTTTTTVPASSTTATTTAESSPTSVPPTTGPPTSAVAVVSATAAPRLPPTGGDQRLMLAYVVAAVTAGVALVMLGRRRAAS